MRHLADIVLNQTPLVLESTVSIVEASRQMYRTRTGSVLVTDERGHLVGIFTGRDAVHRVLAAEKDATCTPLADVMTSNPDTLSPDQSAIEALRLMWDGGFRHVPVLDAERILGVVSRGDFQDSENQLLNDERELWEHMR